jgi:hypothetical protein
MKVFIVLATIISISTARPRLADPSVDCSGAVEGTFLPDPTDCSKFYTCSHGEAVPDQCSPPLLFDSSLNVCNWPSEVDCQVTTTTTQEVTTTEEVTTTPEEVTTTPEEVETTTEEVETTTEEVETTTEDVETTTEEVETTTEEVATTTEEVETTTEAVETTTEEVETTTEEVATTTEEVETTTEEVNTTTEEVTTTTEEVVTTAGPPVNCPEGEYTKVADSKSCEWYYVCQRDGSIDHKKCVFGLYFDQKRQTCNLPFLANCEV